MAGPQNIVQAQIKVPWRQRSILVIPCMYTRWQSYNYEAFQWVQCKNWRRNVVRLEIYLEKERVRCDFVPQPERFQNCWESKQPKQLPAHKKFLSEYSANITAKKLQLADFLNRNQGPNEWVKDYANAFKGSINFGQILEYLQGKKKAQQSLTMNNPNSSTNFSSDQHKRTPTGTTVSNNWDSARADQIGRAQTIRLGNRTTNVISIHLQTVTEPSYQ